MSIRDRVAVVGVGCSKFGEHYDRSAEDQHLWHKAGGRQVKDAEVGLAHNLGGPGAVGCVTVLANG